MKECSIKLYDVGSDDFGHCDRAVSGTEVIKGNFCSGFADAGDEIKESVLARKLIGFDKFEHHLRRVDSGTTHSEDGTVEIVASVAERGGIEINENEFFRGELIIETGYGSDSGVVIKFGFESESGGGGDEFETRTQSGGVDTAREGFESDNLTRFNIVDRLIVGDDSVFFEKIVEPLTGNLVDEIRERKSSPRFERFVGGVSNRHAR